MDFAALHVQSEYSILEAFGDVEGLARKAAEYKMQALALTDQGNLYGAVEFYKACKSVGVKPILGCKLFVAPGSRLEKKRIFGMPHGFPIVLLVKNKVGYRNLCALSSYAHLEGFYYTPRIDKELLERHKEGLICLSGAVEGRVGSLSAQGSIEELESEVLFYKGLFGEDYFFELQRHAMTEERIQADRMHAEGWIYAKYAEYIGLQARVCSSLIDLGKRFSVRCVATNASRYLESSDWKAHEIAMNIQSGEPCEIWEKDSFGNLKARVPNPKRLVLPSHEFYFKSQEEMSALFSDMPEAVNASLEIAQRCCFEMDFKTKYYPVFVPPHLVGSTVTKEERFEAASSFLRELCQERISTRYTQEHLDKLREKFPGKDPLTVVQERLSYELDIIISKGMGDYLLIVYDFIAWAKNQGIPMGPGRGSGAGSIILYLIGITDIEPLRFDLFFERFINPERLSYPDIDVDICMHGRGDVIDYTVQKYGKDKVAQIITFGTMKAKMALKDVGRVLSIPLSRVNTIAKLIPEELNMTLDKALEADLELRSLYENDLEVKEWVDIARKLEGTVRNVGVHAAGIIICGDPLIDHIPLCIAKDSEMAVTQFSMKPVESVGMLKIDFLGLKTLTTIQHTVDAIARRTGETIPWTTLPLHDKKTFDLLTEGRTLGIFQLESTGMQNLVRQLHIDKFEEIIAVCALYRPGPMEMIPSFIGRKHGKEAIEIDHPLMENVLAETYGIMVYQEQVMHIASLLAGYSLGEGDVLRRAMGKKDKEEMAKQREKFVEGAGAKGIDSYKAGYIFDKIEKFASYGFNKSHATAYGYLTYVTAYLKAHYPGEWMAALLTSDADDLTKVSKTIQECREMHISILPPDVNESGSTFVWTPKGIRFSMAAIKGVGSGVVEAIAEERERSGVFSSLYDFLKRVDGKKVGKKAVELLVEVGCFDFTEWSRAALVASIEPMYKAATKARREKSQGVLNLFTWAGKDLDGDFGLPPQVNVEVSQRDILKKERELLGFYLTGHPLDAHKQLLPELSCVPLGDLEKLSSGSICRIAGIVDSVQVRIATKSQKKFAIIVVGDGVCHFEMPIWSDMYEEKVPLLLEGTLVYAVIQLDKEEEQLKARCLYLEDLLRVDAAAMRVCDDVVDKAKKQGRGNAEGRRGFVQQKSAKAVEQKGLLKMHVNADAMRLSHVLELKEILLSASGPTPVHVEFHGAKGIVGKMRIEGSWGVTWSAELERRLGLCPYLKLYALEM